MADTTAPTPQPAYTLELVSENPTKLRVHISRNLSAEQFNTLGEQLQLDGMVRSTSSSASFTVQSPETPEAAVYAVQLVLEEVLNNMAYGRCFKIGRTAPTSTVFNLTFNFVLSNEAARSLRSRLLQVFGVVDVETGDMSAQVITGGLVIITELQRNIVREVVLALDARRVPSTCAFVMGDLS